MTIPELIEKWKAADERLRDALKVFSPIEEAENVAAMALADAVGATADTDPVLFVHDGQFCEVGVRENDDWEGGFSAEVRSVLVPTAEALDEARGALP